ncbi:Putative restriction endonuclease [Sinosporangium album]|uniref:Putative restriction endonuclease n=1 Tax=Sinosporangium album TaxID=504805 RepID=A0A1G7R4N0_9ACTN|nr:Uma2 family endonuclease [Sinosporangium album]SDG05751.1 Putative restriction endonuclease [Sinosporangium album]
MSALPAESWPERSGAEEETEQEIRRRILRDVSRPCTVDDWLALPDIGRRVELIDGSYVVSPAPAAGPALCAQRLSHILLAAAPDDVEVIEAANLRVRDEGFIPDIVVGWAEPIIAGVLALDASDVLMVVEIVSPGNRKRDYVLKPASYAAAGVPFFMRVELEVPGGPLVEVFAAKDGEPVPVAAARAGETLSLIEPYEVSFDPADLAGPRRRGRG